MRTCGRIGAGAGRRGSALVLAIVVVTLVAALGAAFLSVATSTSRRQSGELDTLKAFYLAEAGLAEAFQAVRIGRSGQIGSERVPAAHGDGLVWVDATETADDQVRLESTALVGGGRATLALVVEPVELPLGFFSDEDLVVDSVLLVDGFDSSEMTYEAELQSLYGGSGTREMKLLEPVTDTNLVMDADILYGTGYAGTTETTTVDGTGTDPASGTGDALSSTTQTGTATLPAEHTTSGGLLGSNGAVVFATGLPVAVYGDVVPGPESVVHGVDGVLVTGTTESRSELVELPPVEVPAVALAAPVRHEGLLPRLVPAGTSGHERIEVADGAELVLKGPATIVIGTLVLEPGALLSLDTRDGDVALFITGGLDLQPGSVVTTTSDLPRELSVQVAEIPTGVGGPPVSLEATSRFHGTIYAPDTEVRIGSEFEVHGGVVARRLELGPGARLHFDNEEYEGSPVPRVVSWKIVEIPSAVRGHRVSPWRLFGLESGAAAALAHAHDLAAVQLELEYRNHAGARLTYSGTEDLFDWTQVAEVLDVGRVATRVQEDAQADPDPKAEDPPPAAGIRLDVQATVDSYPTLMTDEDVMDSLQTMTPLSQEEWMLVDSQGFSGGHYKQLVDADLAAGGTGGVVP